MKKIITLIIFLILMNSVFASFTDVLEQAKPISYCGYEIEAAYISEDRVKIRLNDEMSDMQKQYALIEFKDKSRIYIREIMEEDYKEGADRVSIRFYPRNCIAQEKKVINETVVKETKKVSMISKIMNGVKNGFKKIKDKFKK